MKPCLTAFPICGNVAPSIELLASSAHVVANAAGSNTEYRMPSPDQARNFNARAEADELRQQLSSDKRRIIFLFGAGTSQAVGIPGIAALTKLVHSDIEPDLQEHYGRLMSDLGESATVESVLDVVRACRELLRESTDTVRGLTASQAERLDRQICSAISNRVSKEPDGLAPHRAFAAWIRSISRARAVEIFTTNYDVLIERGLEAMEVPHFDGFVGTYEPRFSAASIEADSDYRGEEFRLPCGWVRVWKLHGSITWRLRRDSDGRATLVRVVGGDLKSDEDLMIYPSRDKYSESRKLPYIAFHDRFREVLMSGEVLLITVGYSYSDQHINEAIFEALRWNNRLAVTALVFGEMSASLRQSLMAPTEGLVNLTVYATDRARVAGLEGAWANPMSAGGGAGSHSFWNDGEGTFTLGDFSAFANYLRVYFNPRETVVAPPAATTSAVVTQVNGSTLVTHDGKSAAAPAPIQSDTSSKATTAVS